MSVLNFNLTLQLGPILELWQQLTSSNSGILKSATTAAPAAKKVAGSSEAVSNSIDDFVALENDLSCQLCTVVDNSITALKKVNHI